jgi:hypothetical protein
MYGLLIGVFSRRSERVFSVLNSVLPRIVKSSTLRLPQLADAVLFDSGGIYGLSGVTWRGKNHRANFVKDTSSL